MKNIRIVLVGLLILMLLAGCAENSPTPTPSPGAIPAATVAAPKTAGSTVSPVSSSPSPAVSLSPFRTAILSPVPASTARPLPDATGLSSSGDGSWAWLYPRNPAYLFTDVACPAANACYGVSADGIVAFSADQGASWSKQTSKIADN